MALKKVETMINLLYCMNYFSDDVDDDPSLQSFFSSFLMLDKKSLSAFKVKSFSCSFVIYSEK